jgi:heme-degrading monooxygenase HmoA
MIFVIESYSLKPQYVPQALTVFQKLDDLLGPNAHSNPGHVGHAHFLQDQSDRTQIRLVYEWRDQDSFSELTRSEEPLLSDFLKKYCRAPRLIQVHRELPVEVGDHEHD